MAHVDRVATGGAGMSHVVRLVGGPGDGATLELRELTPFINLPLKHGVASDPPNLTEPPKLEPIRQAIYKLIMGQKLSSERPVMYEYVEPEGPK